MASILRFVDSDLTTVRLTLDWLEEETDLSLPSHSKIWAENSGADGRKYIAGRWTGRTLKLALSVKAASKAAMDTALRALLAELTRENILEFYPDSGSAVFIKTYPMDSASINGLAKEYYRSAFTLHPVMVDLPADPFWYGAEETITVVDNLIPNASFEDYAGSGNTTNWTGWEETRTNGAGTTTVEALAGAAVFGAVGAHLKITANDGIAKIISTDFITIDKTKHYCFSMNHYRVGGADTFNWNIQQYDTGGVAGTLYSANLAGAAAWRQDVITIHPSTENTETYYWDADCAKVKLEFWLDTTVAEWYMDGLVLTCSEYLSSNELNNALGIVLPPALILGDVPAPCDIYLDKFEDTESTAAIYIGGREAYDAGFVARLENSLGTAAYSNLASGGAYKTQAVPGELLTDGGFNEITGAAGSGTETWDHWDETRPAGSVLTAYPVPYDAPYCVRAQRSSVGASISIGLESTAAVAVNPALNYLFSVWYQLYNNTGQASLDINIECFNAGHASVGHLHAPLITANKYTWTNYTYAVPAANWPATTAEIKIEIWMNVAWAPPDDRDTIMVDLASFMQTTSALSAQLQDYSDHIEGFVRPFFHYKTSAAATKNLSLQAKLVDDALGDITSLAEQETKSVSMLTTWIYQDFPPIELPTSKVPDAATTTSLEQYLEVDFDSSIAGATTLSIDDLSLIPVENGYAAIPAESNSHLIIDCQSDLPGVLASLDGTLDTAVWYESGGLRDRFTLDPINGSNLAVLEDFRDSSGNAFGQFLMELKLKYRPRYLAVK